MMRAERLMLCQIRFSVTTGLYLRSTQLNRQAKRLDNGSMTDAVGFSHPYQS